jgi:hypothetical protein
MYQATAMNGAAVMQCLLQRVEDEARMRCSRHAPTDDAPGEEQPTSGDSIWSPEDTGSQPFIVKMRIDCHYAARW